MKSLTVYLGWDSREAVAYAVASASIRRRTPNAWVGPLELDSLERQGILTRPVERRGNQLWCPISDAPMSTEFAISRFAVPFIHAAGWALFTDCDVLCLADLHELFTLADDRFAVMCVKHGNEANWVPCELACGCKSRIDQRVWKGSAMRCEVHSPPSRTKMFQVVAVDTSKMVEQTQTAYPRKNWSSVVLWNCSHPSNRKLTLDMLNTLPGRDLHRFCWLEDHEIGELPPEWNHLVGVNVGNPNAKLLHFTLGGPWIEGWGGGVYDYAWKAEAEAAGVQVPEPAGVV